jgi:hypothetical protein
LAQVRHNPHQRKLDHALTLPCLSCHHPSGSRYEGEWKDAKACGKGVFVWSFGDRYEGDYRNGKPNGKGTYFWKDGSKYEGEWRHGKKHGKGKFTWPEVRPDLHHSL